MMVSSMAISSILSMFCSPRSLFEILRSLSALYIPYDAVFAHHILGQFLLGGRMIRLYSSYIVLEILVVDYLGRVVVAVD